MRKGPLPQPESERFWRKVQRGAPDECWPWQASRAKAGYGYFGRTEPVRKCLSAHRVAWELTHGPIPAGLEVCHRCDNPGCVNPDHLFLGTHADNMADMAAKGRARNRPVRGSSHPMAKLDEAAVRDIRASYALCRVTQRELAARYHVDRTAISMVVLGKTWCEGISTF